MSDVEFTPAALDANFYPAVLKACIEHPLSEAVEEESPPEQVEDLEEPSDKSSNVKEMDDPLSVFSSVATGMDPLSMMASAPKNSVKTQAAAGDDPLSMAGLRVSAASSSSEAADNAAQKAQNLAMEREAERNRIMLAQSRFKERIRCDYQMTGKITLNKSNMSTGSQGLIVDGANQAISNHDMYDERLRALEKKTLKYDYVELSQKDYENHVTQLREALDSAWRNDERVESLKIAIQIAKLLGDATVPAHYPTIFLLVTDALEDFGKRVHLRLRRKCDECLATHEHQLRQPDREPTFPEEFPLSDVPQGAREIARNWFYKVACIRELVPRLYVEIMLTPCYAFLMEKERFQNELERIALQIRGLGDPLIAMYARAYLVHTGERLVGRAPHSPCPDFTLQALEDTCLLEASLREKHCLEYVEKKGCTMVKYRSLMLPALDWLLVCVGNGASKDTFRRTMASYQCTMEDQTKYIGGSAPLLRGIIDSFDAGMYASSALEIASLARNADTLNSPVTTVQIFTTLAKKLALHPPEEEEHRNKFLNTTWRVAMQSPTDQLVPFVECAAALLDLVQRHFKGHEIPRILQDVVSRIDGKEREVPADVARAFELILLTLFGGNAEVTSRVLTSDAFLKLLDVFRGPKRVSVCQQILHVLRNMPRTGDPILIATLFEVGRAIHDATDRLTAKVDSERSANLICSFVSKIDFGNDLEQQLSSYVECRAAFTNMDTVQDRLVLCVSHLAMRANHLVKGKHTRRTANFVKSCMAFCHITIPSIGDVLRKLKLTVHCAQVALNCQLLPQTDTLLRATAKLIPLVPLFTIDPNTGRKSSNSEELFTNLRVLLSFIIIVPGNPEFGPFYIVNMLLRELPRYEWPAGSPYRVKVFMEILTVLCSYAQETLPYHVPGVESNDTLYAGDSDYSAELHTRVQQCMVAIEGMLVDLEEGGGTAHLTQSRLLMELASLMGARLELTKPVCVYILNLLKKAATRKDLFTRADTQLFASTRASLKAMAIKRGADVLAAGLA